jgi:hypothetical protein
MLHRSSDGQIYQDGIALDDFKAMEVKASLDHAFLIERHQNNLTNEYTLIFNLDSHQSRANFADPYDIV